MWGGYWVVVNSDAWKGLSKSVQETVVRLNTEAALKQRADVAAIETKEPARLVGYGMAVNRPEPAAFVKKMREAGFYSQWRDTFGEAGWRALEKYAGPLA